MHAEAIQLKDEKALYKCTIYIYNYRLDKLHLPSAKHAVRIIRSILWLSDRGYIKLLLPPEVVLSNLSDYWRK